MTIIRIVLIAVVLTLAAFAAMALIGIALSLLRILFWVVVICIVVALLAKLFGAKNEPQAMTHKEQDKLHDAELTLEEYKRKLATQLQNNPDRRP